MGSSAAHRRLSAGVLLVGLLLGCAGCASTYDEGMLPVHEAFYGGRPEVALDLLVDELEEVSDGDALLLRLELASALQALGRYELASHHLGVADQGLEVLDYTAAPLDDLAAFALGVDGAWRASPPERVMVNTQNMLNYAARGDLEGAAVEARRLGVHLTRQDVPPEELYANSFAWGLAGTVLLARGRLGQAAEAFQHLPAEHPLQPPERRAPRDHGTLLVVVQLGRAPIRREARFSLVVDGRSRPVAVPVLQARPDMLRGAHVVIDDGPPQEVPLAFDLGAHLLRRFEDELPRLMAAALTQAVLRTAVSEIAESAAQRAVEDELEDQDAASARAAGQLAGDLLGLATDWTLQAVQRTDTRCWSLMAGRFLALRVDLPAGSHAVRLSIDGLPGPATVEVVDVQPGGLSVVHALSGPREGWRPLPDPRGGSLMGTQAGVETLRLLEGASHVVADVQREVDRRRR